MKYIKQFGLILAIAFLGEVCNFYIPLPIPASIYGLVLLFVGLVTGVIKLEWVKDVGKFLIEIMPVMFIPAAVGLLESWEILEPIWIPVVSITLITTVFVMVVTGRVTQWMLRRKNRVRKASTTKDEGVDAHE